MAATVSVDPFLQKSSILIFSTPRRKLPFFIRPRYYSCSGTWRVVPAGVSFCNFRPRPSIQPSKASSTDTALMRTFESSADVLFKETFPLTRTEKVEGKIFIRLDQEEVQSNWQLTVGCSLPGRWIIHWGVSYVSDTGSEWDQPPQEMRPHGSMCIRDYAIETPLTKASESDTFNEVKIKFNLISGLSAIHFVLKDEETGSWYQHRGRDFKVPLVGYPQEDSNMVGTRRGLWPGFSTFGKLPNIFVKQELSRYNDQEDSNELAESKIVSRQLEGFYEEQPIIKELSVDNVVKVTLKKCPETAKNLIYLETDIPGDVIVHWGICKDNDRRWEIPDASHPPQTTVFKSKALRTLLQPKGNGSGSQGLFTLDEQTVGFLFVLKLCEDAWLKWNGSDFYIPLSSSSSSTSQANQSDTAKTSEETDKMGEVSSKVYTDEIINEIRNLVSGLSSEKTQKMKTREAQESIIQEIEKLAAEAYSMFRSSIPSFTEETGTETKETEPPSKICSGTGSGFEILCQGFNWESHKSRRWYVELKEKAAELSSLGFTVSWLPPPTESVSPEGYMPTDLYNFNSRYGNIHELKELVKAFHGVGLRVLGDVVLNHRCAQYQNQNGVWNIFGGHLNWDDRAIVSDDPHFQGRGNKSSGDNFHAAPNIDHSQEFVRKDLKEWLCWLRKEIGYDGWRLDFVRGFWGGYVKDYLDASEPYFAVGEYWDSLSYTYNDMDYNQDAHRQRIVDWINATNGTAGAFDVTTKGILHTALERCEYWRLSDSKGKPPGVVGWWPSRAVTFVENHDTGSTQGHWRFPRGKEMQGYAYILTHPGTPAVFYDHVFSNYQSEIAALISIRNRKEIHCRSTVKIVKAERDVYAAIIDDKVAMKIGPGHYEPQEGPQSWAPSIEGSDYKVWEAS